jgi:3-hydroxybutyryl-CoA dehydrogenase
VVIEAIPDDLALKQALLQKLDSLVHTDAILATSTDTLSVTALAAATKLPGRVVGLHFCKPAYLMRLVEVVRGEHTRQEVLERTVEFVRSIGKTPLTLADTPGLIVNRIAQAYYGEALSLLDDSGLDIQTIDRLMEAAGFPMGPFRLMDFIGVDKVFKVTQVLYEATFHSTPYRPHPRQQRLIAAGRLGQESGKGFYEE